MTYDEAANLARELAQRFNIPVVVKRQTSEIGVPLKDYRDYYHISTMPLYESSLHVFTALPPAEIERRHEEGRID